MTHLIALTDYEMKMCADVGEARYSHALTARRNPGLGPSANRIGARNDIRGARCEYAVSIILNLSWRPTIGQIKSRDVGDCVDVRSTELPRGRLIIKPADPDGVPFVLAIAPGPDREGSTFMVPGWVFAGAAKVYPLLTGHGDPAHFVDQANLSSIAALKNWIKEVTR